MHAIVSVTDMVSLEAIVSSSGDGPAVTFDLNHEIVVSSETMLRVLGDHVG